MEALSLYLDEDDRQIYFQDEIEHRKRMSGIQEVARQKAKLSYCYYCKKEVTSFCNSHSVPKFCLKRLSVDGKLYYVNTLIELPFLVNVKSTYIPKMPSQRTFSETANSYLHLLGLTFRGSIPWQQLAKLFWLSKI